MPNIVPVETFEALFAAKPTSHFATSYDVASLFDRRHRDVLRDIRNLRKHLSAHNGGDWFQETSVEQRTGFGVRHIPAFNMNRDGFTILVLGFKGRKAAAFKRRYIEAFNAMEEELKRRAQLGGANMDPAAAARAYADKAEAAEAYARKIREQRAIDSA